MNNHELKKDDIKDYILRKINTKELSMRPKLFFTLKIVAVAMLAALVLLVSIFILNFILFSIRINSHDALLGFGPRGWSAFAHFFPWPLLILDIIFVTLLGFLLRKFRFGYKTPVLYLLVALLGGSAVLGFVVDRGTGMNERFLRNSDERKGPPPFGDIYGHARRPLPPGSGLFSGVIESIDGRTLFVKDARSTTTLKVILQENNTRATTTGLAVGDMVFGAGEMKEGVMEAYGVRKASKDGSFPPRFLR